jgi:hypothetical protein
MWLLPAAVKAGADLHWLWDDRCASCHGHSAEFARKFLSVSNGELQGRHHLDNLRQFMRNHYLPDSETDATYEMLLAQVLTPPRFRDECSRCHNSASEFVRQALEFRKGVLTGRESGEWVRGFLDRHRGLASADVRFYSDLLERVADEVYRVRIIEP